MNSRSKGIKGELAWRDEVRARGYDAERGQQHAGGGDSPDVKHSIPGVHFEVKRVERFALYDAVNQARRDAATGNMPVVVHRCNPPGPKGSNKREGDCRGEWLVVLGADDYFELLRRAGHGPISTA